MASTRVTLGPSSFAMPWSAMRPGHRAFQGQVAMLPSRPDGFLTTPEAARLAGRTAATIRKWRQRGWLAPQGLDERYRPLHTAEAVRAAEQLVRQHGLEASGVDPRLLRKPPPLAA